MDTASNRATNLCLPVGLTPAPLNPPSSDHRGPVLSEHVRPETGPQAEGSGACEASDIPGWPGNTALLLSRGGDSEDRELRRSAAFGFMGLSSLACPL